jgi:AcrR family transcriptional regulator
MARHTTITDDQILDAARALFIEEGFRARTSKVAQLAGVSEGTIFKRFETKERLFLAALQIPYPAPWHGLTERLAGTGDVRENLVTISVQMITFFQHTIPQMLAAAGVKLGPPGLHEPDEQMDRMIQADLDKIHVYLKHEQDLGRVRKMNTRLLATMLFGCFANPALRAVFPDEQTEADIRRNAEEMIDILWSGLKPE